jgi:hypothetical protein
MTKAFKRLPRWMAEEELKYVVPNRPFSNLGLVLLPLAI